MSKDLLKHTARNWRRILYFDLLIAATISIVIGWLPDYARDHSLYERVIVMEVAAAGALLAFALVGVSVLIAILKDDDFLLFLYQDHPHALHGAIWPFWFLAVLVVLAVIIGVTSIALVPSSCILARRITIGFVSLFFLWSVTYIPFLISFVGGMLDLRAMHRKLTDSKTE